MTFLTQLAYVIHLSLTAIFFLISILFILLLIHLKYLWRVVAKDLLSSKVLILYGVKNLKINMHVM